MTLDEAIEIQEEIIRKGSLGNVFEAYPAMQLGIEALKREQILRCEIPYDREGLLPSESADYPA